MQGDWNAKVGRDACENWQGICGPFCNNNTDERALRLLEFATFNDPVLANTFGHHKTSRRWTWHNPHEQHHNHIDYILVRKRFQSGVNSTRTRSFPGADIGSDHDLLMMTIRLRLKKNQQARNQVWPRKADRSQCVGNLPSYTRREVRTSHHYECWRCRHGFNDHQLQHSSNWNSQWDPWQTSSEEKKPGSLQKLFICATKGENWERRDLNQKDLKINGSYNIKRCMKKAKENWIGEQCSETEEHLRKNNSKRAYQLVKDLATAKQRDTTTVQDRSGKCLTEERQIQYR